MKKDNENHPEISMARIMVLTETQFRDHIIDFYTNVITSSIKECIKDGFPIGIEMMQGIDRLTVQQIIENVETWIEITMDINDDIDGIMVMEDEGERTWTVVTDF